jgi:chorismate lyase / 3-hydroxybenzoate synthase
MLKPEQEKLLSQQGISIPSWARDLAPTVQHCRDAELSTGVTASLTAYSGVDASLIVAVLPNATKLTADNFHDSVATLACTVLEELSRCPHANVARMWNFIPGIYDDIPDGTNRYELFNKGRFDGFSRWFGQTKSFSTMLPAASAVGHDQDTLSMSAIGTTTAGTRIENSRQIPAFKYSKDHGDQPPCFARAVLSDFGDGPRLVVSGTASILGEDSMHRESLELQTEETFRNLECLAKCAPRTHRFSLGHTESARIYYPFESDQPWLQDTLKERLPESTEIEFVPAWLCRPELLVEIELIIKPSDPLDPDPM